MTKLFVILKNSSLADKTLHMLNFFVYKGEASMSVSRNPNVYKYRVKLGIKTVDVEVVVVESDLQGNGTQRMREISKMLKIRITNFPAVVKKIGSGMNAKGEKMITSKKTTFKNISNFALT